MTKERMPKECPSSKPTECKMCKKQLPRNKLIFSYCSNGWLCLECYKSQFTPTPMHPKPIYIKSYGNIGR